VLARHFGVAVTRDCGRCDRCRRRIRVALQLPTHEPAVALSPRQPDADEDSRYERLRAWRRVQANRDKVPEFNIFPDTILRQIARANPQNWRLLRTVAGGDSYKIDKFGQDILDLLTAG